MAAPPEPLSPPDRTESFPLRGRLAPVALFERGLFHPRSTVLGGIAFTRYEDVTHVISSQRGLRLGTRHGVFLLHRAAFLERRAPEQLGHALLGRIAASPGGREQLERMERLDERLREARRPLVTPLLLVLCVAFYALQTVHDPQTTFAASFSATLVGMGELWRLITANFLHGFLGHLLLNALCLVVLGTLAELSLGAAAAAFVMGVSGLGAMGGSWLAGYELAVGASGIVSGLIGALLWLEWRRPRDVPTPWRFPRRLLLTALVAENLLLLFVPSIAHAAHLGGFVGGVFASALVAGPALAGVRPRWLLATNGALALMVVASCAAAGWAAFAGADALLARRAERLLAHPDLPPAVLNEHAWLIAISRSPSANELEVARQLAERAVRQTRRREPNILDTLAEVYFASGRVDDAVDTINEAISLAPAESYFREQRRRFTGERAAGDRPAPPGLPGRRSPRPDSEPDGHEPEDPGLRV